MNCARACAPFAGPASLLPFAETTTLATRKCRWMGYLIGIMSPGLLQVLYTVTPYT